MRSKLVAVEIILKVRRCKAIPSNHRFILTRMGFSFHSRERNTLTRQLLRHLIERGARYRSGAACYISTVNDCKICRFWRLVPQPLQPSQRDGCSRPESMNPRLRGPVIELTKHAFSHLPSRSSCAASSAAISRRPAFSAISRGVSQSSMRVRRRGSAPACRRSSTADRLFSLTAMCSGV